MAGRSGAEIEAALASVLRSTQGGRNLKKIGLQHDIDLAARLDQFAVVPELQLQQWKIVLPDRYNV